MLSKASPTDQANARSERSFFCRTTSGLSERLRHSLERLSPEHGEVIDLVYYHGKSVKDAAEIIGISEATAKTRMFYARRKLADLVAPA